MRGAPRAALLLAIAASLASPAGARPPTETSLYEVGGAAPWRAVRSVEKPGYRVRLSSPDGRALLVRVEVDGAPLPDEAPFPPGLSGLPPEALRLVEGGLPADPELDRVSRLVTRGSRTVLEAVERVVGYTSRRIRYEAPTQREESASRCLSLGRGSCVGRSLLAEELLRRAGIPARQVTGLLTAARADELAAEARPFWGESVAGVRHRWIEAYVPRLGWVPSDPAGLANTVTARHLELFAAPGPDLRVAVVSRGEELKRPRLPLLGAGVTLGRPRVSPVLVRNADSPDGGSVVLVPQRAHAGAPASRVVRTGTAVARFESVPSGDYRVVWRRPDGRLEAASLRVDGPASLDLGARGAGE